MFGQPVETAFPEDVLAFDPLPSLLQRIGIHAQEVLTSFDASGDEASLFENAQVFRNCRQRHGVRLGKFRYACLARAEFF